ncbi:unnamed protein product [Amoebophrya sp. A120]|nr:unnamed protein product [Amoebophrya sp. A120]|eukprot:GSA120T00010173001.1
MRLPRNKIAWVLTALLGGSHVKTSTLALRVVPYDPSDGEDRKELNPLLPDAKTNRIREPKQWGRGYYMVVTPKGIPLLNPRWLPDKSEIPPYEQKKIPPNNKVDEFKFEQGDVFQAKLESIRKNGEDIQRYLRISEPCKAWVPVFESMGGEPMIKRIVEHEFVERGIPVHFRLPANDLVEGETLYERKLQEEAKPEEEHVTQPRKITTEKVPTESDPASETEKKANSIVVEEAKEVEKKATDKWKKIIMAKKKLIADAKESGKPISKVIEEAKPKVETKKTLTTEEKKKDLIVPPLGKPKANNAGGAKEKPAEAADATGKAKAEAKPNIKSAAVTSTTEAVVPPLPPTTLVRTQTPVPVIQDVNCLSKKCEKGFECVNGFCEKVPNREHSLCVVHECYWIRQQGRASAPPPPPKVDAASLFFLQHKYKYHDRHLQDPSSQNNTAKNNAVKNETASTAPPSEPPEQPTLTAPRTQFQNHTEEKFVVNHAPNATTMTTDPHAAIGLTNDTTKLSRKALMKKKTAVDHCSKIFEKADCTAAKTDGMCKWKQTDAPAWFRIEEKETVEPDITRSVCYNPKRYNGIWNLCCKQCIL